MKKFLVIYYRDRFRLRKTLDNHLFSFRRYLPPGTVHYFNTVSGLPSYFKLCQYDGVILHYTVFALRWDHGFFERFLTQKIKGVSLIPGVKIAIPQDEYAYTDGVIKLLKLAQAHIVFGRIPQRLVAKLYPSQKISLQSFFDVLPGYADETTLTWISRRNHAPIRPIDIGYRVRRAPYWLGRQGLIKVAVGEKVRRYCRRHTNLVTDIKIGEETLSGDAWIRFLLRSKAVLGCEGGSSLVDHGGTIRSCTEKFLKHTPKATFTAVEQACFPGRDGRIILASITPRHFEAAMTKTCQILVEGEYNSILKPDIHYIPLKRDLSNIAEAIAKFQDESYREFLVNNAYRDLIASGEYSYRQFVYKVASCLPHRQKPRESVAEKLLFKGVGVLALVHSMVGLIIKVIRDLLIYHGSLLKQRFRLILRDR